MKLTKIAAASLVALALATSAQAALMPITGDVFIAGLTTADVDFGTKDVVFASKTNNALFTVVTGDFVALAPAGSQLTYNDFNWSTFAGTNPIWANALVSFQLTSVAGGQTPQGNLSLVGSGIIKSDGYQDTLGSWSFSADKSGSVFAFSSTATAKVPDGGTTLTMLGLSFLGLGGVSRLLRRK